MLSAAMLSAAVLRAAVLLLAVLRAAVLSTTVPPMVVLAAALPMAVLLATVSMEGIGGVRKTPHTKRSWGQNKFGTQIRRWRTDGRKAKGWLLLSLLFFVRLAKA